MIKTNPNSRIAIKSLDQLNDTCDVILQAEKTGSVFSDSKKDVYLCEVVSRRNYHERAIDDLIGENVKLSNENRRLRNTVDRLKKQAEASQKGRDT